MLLEVPNAKDPQDAEVAKMLLENPKGFALKANEWAVKYAGAPPAHAAQLDLSKFQTIGTRAPVDESRFVDAGEPWSRWGMD